MTLDGSIRWVEYLADQYDMKSAISEDQWNKIHNRQDAKRCRQVADWLKKLKELEGEP